MLTTYQATAIMWLRFQHRYVDVVKQMKCSNCGALNRGGNEFCKTCGARLLPADPPSAELGLSKVPQQLRSLGFADIGGQTLKLYWWNFWTFICVAAILQAPLLVWDIASVVFGLTPKTILPDPGTGQQDMGSFLISEAVIYLRGTVPLLIQSLIEAAIAIGIAHYYLDNKVTIRACLAPIFSKAWRLLGTFLFPNLLMFLVAITILGLPYSIFLLIRWSFRMQSIVLEGTGMRQSLYRSAELVKGNWWRVLCFVILAWIAQYLLQLILVNIFGALVGANDPVAFPNSSIWVKISFASGSRAIEALAAPLLAIVITLLYYNLRIQKEGLQLQMPTVKTKTNKLATRGRK